MKMRDPEANESGHSNVWMPVCAGPPIDPGWQADLTTVVAALRIAALAACPNPRRHRSLQRGCAEPLEHALQDETLTRWLEVTYI